MSCFLTDNFGGQLCEPGVSGVRRLVLIPKEKLPTSAITLNAKKTAATALAPTDSSKFLEIFFANEECSFNQEFKVAGSSRYMLQTLSFIVSGKNETTLEQAHQVLLGKHVAVVECEDDNWRLLGYASGMKANGGSDNSGKGPDDESGLTFVLEARAKGYAPIVPASVIEALIKTSVSI